MTSPAELSRLISRDHLLRSLKNATGRTDVQLYGNAEVKMATGEVEGFLSMVLRVKVRYSFKGDDSRVHSMVFVVKCMPEVEAQIEIVKECNVFLREGVFFDKVVPVIEEISRGRMELPLPVCYASVYGGENDAIYMEDLSQRGFRTPDFKYRVDGLDLPHCIISMEKLGRLQGLLCAAEKALPPEEGKWTDMYPEFKKEAMFMEQLPGDPPKPYVSMVEKCMETLGEFSKEIDGLPKEAEGSGMLKKIFPWIHPMLCKMVMPNPKGRNVLGHGDCWMNNFMFRYETDESGVQKPVDAKLIDLQLVRYCHPCIDILYFMYLGTTKTFRDKHMDQLITVYYNSLADTLRALGAGLPPLTLAELFEDLHGLYKPFGITVGILFAPIIFLGDYVPEKADDMSPEMFKEFFEGGNSSMVRMRFSTDPTYRAKVEENVREFMDMAFPNGIESLDSCPILI